MAEPKVKDSVVSTGDPTSHAESMREIEAAVKLVEVVPEGEPAPSEEGEEPVGDKPEAPVESQETKPPETEPTPEAEKPQDSVAKSWDAVKEAEKRTRTLRDEMRREKSELQRLKADLEGKSKSERSFLEKLRENPLEALKEAGVTYEHLTERVLSDNKPGEGEKVTKVERYIQTLEEKMVAMEKRLQDQQAREQYASAMYHVGETLKADEFSLLNSRKDAAKNIIDFADKYWQTHQQSISAVEAARILQDALKEELRETLSHKAVREALKDVWGNPVDSKPPTPTPTKSSPGSKTLNNKMAAGGPAESDEEERDDTTSPYEEIRKAAKLVPPDVWENFQA